MRSRILMISSIAVGVIIVFSLLVSLGKRQAPPAGEDKKTAKSAQELYTLGATLEKKGELVAAKDAYRQIIFESPNFSRIDEVKKKYEDLNMRIIFSNVPVPGLTQSYEVKSGDSLSKIAKQFKTTVELLKRSNGLQSDAIQAGGSLRVWLGKFSVAVDKSQNTLTLKSNEEIIKVYPVATGLDNCTPIGTFTIVNRIPHPVWYKEGEIVPPESSENILGTRWLGFDLAGYGIHGTTDPESIGNQATEGCVRMLNSDVEELYSLLPAGVEVIIVD
ncbi:L,D-transpeptidase family protein [Candidatus Omnitrophota bacterium]